MMGAVRRLCDGRDTSIEAHIVLSLLAFIALLAFQGYATWRTGDFSASAFGEAVSLILCGGGGMGIGQAFLNRSRSRGQHVDNPDQ